MKWFIFLSCFKLCSFIFKRRRIIRISWCLALFALTSHRVKILQFISQNFFLEITITISSNKIAKLILYILLNDVEFQDEFFVAGYPVDDRITQILLILGLLMAQVQLILRLLLLIERKVLAALDALPANTKAFIHLAERFVLSIEAMHWAAGTLIINHIKLFVQKCVEVQLPLLHPLIQHVEDHVVHVIHLPLLLRNIKKLPHFVMIFNIIFRKINIEFVVHFLVGLLLLNIFHINATLLHQLLFSFLRQARIALE